MVRNNLGGSDCRSSSSFIGFMKVLVGKILMKLQIFHGLRSSIHTTCCSSIQGSITLNFSLKCVSSGSSIYQIKLAFVQVKLLFLSLLILPPYMLTHCK